MKMHKSKDMITIGNGALNATIKIGKATAAVMDARDT